NYSLTFTKKTSSHQRLTVKIVETKSPNTKTSLHPLPTMSIKSSILICFYLRSITLAILDIRN
ncbi:MAG: hypothetical protein ACKPKW_10425, partial [Dolichospermum sp.]